MQASDLRHTLTIQKNISDGTTDPIWQDVCMVKAAKNKGKYRLMFQAAAEQSETYSIFTIRFRTDIFPLMRITEGNLVYEIAADLVDIDDRRRWLDIFVRRITQNGS